MQKDIKEDTSAGDVAGTMQLVGTVDDKVTKRKNMQTLMKFTDFLKSKNSINK